MKQRANVIRLSIQGGINVRVLPVFASVAIILLICAVGCSSPLDSASVESVVAENPTAEDVLASNPNADIFQFDGVIYQTGIDWVEELTLTKDEKVGEIIHKNETDTNFEDEMSNKLPVGAKIYSVEEREEIGGPILLVEFRGNLLSYYGLVEG